MDKHRTEVLYPSRFSFPYQCPATALRTRRRVSEVATSMWTACASAAWSLQASALLRTQRSAPHALWASTRRRLGTHKCVCRALPIPLQWLLEQVCEVIVCACRGATASSVLLMSALASTVLQTPSKCQQAMLLAHLVLQTPQRLLDPTHPQLANAF